MMTNTVDHREISPVGMTTNMMIESIGGTGIANSGIGTAIATFGTEICHRVAETDPIEIAAETDIPLEITGGIRLGREIHWRTM